MGKILLHTDHTNPPRSHYHDMDITVVDSGKEVYFILGGPKGSPSDTPSPGEILSGELKRL